MLVSVSLSNLTVNVKNTIYSNMVDPLFLSLGVIRSFCEMYIESHLVKTAIYFQHNNPLGAAAEASQTVQEFLRVGTDLGLSLKTFV